MAAGASMLSEFWLAPNLFPIPHFQTDHRDLHGCALNSCQQMPGSRIVRGSKVKGRAECASQGHATKRRGRLQSPIRA